MNEMEVNRNHSIMKYIRLKAKLFYLIVCLLFINHHPYAQSIDGTLALKFQSTIDSMRIAKNIKGLSACIIYPGQGIWKGVTGISHTGVPITSEMEFGLGSNTKLFTAVVILKLVESNIIQLDESLYKWLPIFANVDSTITIRQLLNHTSGLKDINSVPGYGDSIGVTQGNIANASHIYTPTQIMTWIGAPLFAPGSSWSYSNTNYIIAAMVAESATAKSFGKLLDSLVLIPLQLDSTFLDVYEQVTGTIAHPWQQGIDNNSIPRIALNSVASSAGAMYSIAGEMAQWYQAIMAGQVLNNISFSEMTTFVGPSHYGFGIAEQTVTECGRTVWAHDGVIWGGYNSEMMYDTISKAIICVLSNTNTNPASALPVAKQLLCTLINHSTNAVNSIPPAENTFLIYPNPSTGIVHIRTKEEEIRSIHIYNSLGQIVHESFTSDLSIENLQNGIYFIHIQTNKTKLVKPIIKN